MKKYKKRNSKPCLNNILFPNFSPDYVQFVSFNLFLILSRPPDAMQCICGGLYRDDNDELFIALHRIHCSDSFVQA